MLHLTGVFGFHAIARHLFGVPSKSRFRDKITEQVAHLCATNECQMSDKGIDDFRVSYPDGWWFETQSDGYSTEVTAEPLDAVATQENESRLQRAVFDTGRDAELRPAGNGNVNSGGHVNISAEAFFADPILFRNFLVDFANHSELASDSAEQ